MDMHLFYTGESFDSYEWLGAHIKNKATTFRTFAPNADRVSLILENKEIPMKKVANGQFYEITVENCPENTTYEYRIYRWNSYVDHCDPYGYGMELRPNHRSIVRNLRDYTFKDNKWMSSRKDEKNGPVNIYELHFGSWKKKGEKWYQYNELANLLIPYLKEGHYTHVEFMPLSEHPSDESWGYQNTGFFAPTSRYGTATQLMELIDKLHQNGIGVILDFVPTHFALDSYGLGNYDGDALYEYPHADVGVSEWGSFNFIHSRGEVRSFLQSCAHYWLKEFHFDGLRMDAVRNLIYWQGNEKRGVNHNAILFLKNMNHGLKKLHPDCMLIAEDSSNYPNVTLPSEKGGLGFDYKWDMGWMHDTLDYFQLPPWERPANYHKLTFSMHYYWNESYLLALSHDEVVHLKKTIINKMYGDYQDKFAQLRAFYLYMIIHPGKKLNFMGNEIAHFREWDEKRQQDWNLLDYPIHDGFWSYIKQLNKLYLEHPAFYEGDYEKNSFEWLDCHQEEKCIYAMIRKGKKESLAAIFNFSDKNQTYSLKLPASKKITLLCHSEWAHFGGRIKDDGSHIFKNSSMDILLPSYSGILFSLK
ncbi:MAG: 1,4-alpha-glucan branching protein GlgB [Eubacteriales bacterium]|nr:1,4-alpha-glucan branching protein GlgB [Eubacteriales bacterium]